MIATCDCRVFTLEPPGQETCVDCKTVYDHDTATALIEAGMARDLEGPTLFSLFLNLPTDRNSE